MIVAQVTAIIGDCPSCGHQGVTLIEMVDTKVGMTLHVVCEDCVDEEEKRL